MARVIEERSSRRMVLAAAVTVLVLAVAVIAGLMSPTTGGTPVIFVERISSAISNTASRVGDAWWVYAFALGAVAAFNPCGFALVPAYLGLYLGEDVDRGGLGARLSRSITVAGVVGVALAGGGGLMLAGKPLASTLPQQLATRLGGDANRSGIRGFAAFG